ncbi:MAG TPA: hypothetical protein ENN41_00350 [Sediminispirochaeta sp.]|nr:hypothetical protein [Sediminispirochaeta sp.]
MAESLTSNFVGFLDDLKKPLEEIEKKAQSLLEASDGASSDFVALVLSEVKKASSSVRNLEEKIADVQRKNQNLADDEKMIKDLDKKLNEHFVHLQKDEAGLQE